LVLSGGGLPKEGGSGDSKSGGRFDGNGGGTRSIISLFYLYACFKDHVYHVFCSKSLSITISRNKI